VDQLAPATRQRCRALGALPSTSRWVRRNERSACETTWLPTPDGLGARSERPVGDGAPETVPGSGLAHLSGDCVVAQVQF
jgi:hypothetical protein